MFFAFLFVVALAISLVLILKAKSHTATNSEILIPDDKRSVIQNFQRSEIVPHTRDMIYPAALPQFEEIAANGHIDQRAVIYTILFLNFQKKRIFPCKKIHGNDFGTTDKAYQALLAKGLIQEPLPEETLATLYTKDKIKGFLQDRGLRAKGSKREMAKMLLNNGFSLDTSSDENKLFVLTEGGLRAIEEYYTDERRAIFLAIDSLKQTDFGGAICAYRDFDSKWGFVHTSGKRHTIFADYNIPYSRFEFIARYSMPELNNSADFKRVLRACIIAGTMSKHKERWEIADFFEQICHEPIRCPNIVDYYRAGDDGEYSYVREGMYTAMQKNVEASNRYVLEYYISHVKYLSKQ